MFALIWESNSRHLDLKFGPLNLGLEIVESQIKSSKSLFYVNIWYQFRGCFCWAELSRNSAVVFFWSKKRTSMSGRKIENNVDECLCSNCFGRPFVQQILQRNVPFCLCVIASFSVQYLVFLWSINIRDGQNNKQNDSFCFRYLKFVSEIKQKQILRWKSKTFLF